MTKLTRPMKAMKKKTKFIGKMRSAQRLLRRRVCCGGAAKKTAKLPNLCEVRGARGQLNFVCEPQREGHFGG